MKAFWLSFVPLFVAVDAVGVLPVFLSLTEGMDRMRLRTVIIQSVITASVVALVFLAFGPLFLSFLGITVPDFMIAGGILLLAISLSDLITGEKRQRQTDSETLGAVPIGIPLITGPAVLTTCVLLSGLHGKLVTGMAAVVNIALAGLLFQFSKVITKSLGQAGIKTLSKVASLLLAAIAVMLIRRGITAIIALPPI
ncbi:MAG: MarC family protein [Nitrospinota bacterium]|nr:MarC family protein [Nitrospinota bacterium]